MDEPTPYPPIPPIPQSTPVVLPVTTHSTIAVEIKFVLTITDDYTLSDALIDMKHLRKLIADVSSDVEKFDTNMSSDLQRQTI